MAKSQDTAKSTAAQRLDAEVEKLDDRGLDEQAPPTAPKIAPHDEGSQANETIDGLDDETEAVRHAAEDVPTGADQKIDNVPVFDRAGLPPKV